MSETLHRTPLDPAPLDGTTRRRSRSGPHRVVIVGGGFGGLTTARGLGGAEGIEVTLIDRRNHHLFQPLLYQVATAVIAPGEIAEPIRAILRWDRNVRVLMGEVVGVDTKDARCGSATAPASPTTRWCWRPAPPTAISAIRNGSASRRASRPSTMPADPRPGAAGLRGGGARGRPGRAGPAVDLRGDRRRADRGRDGRRHRGLAHHALSKDFRRIDPKQAKILLIEAAPRVLGTFTEDLSAYAREALERLGVTVLTEHAVEDVSEEGVTVAGKLIPAATIVWGAGVRASPAGEWLGVETTRTGHVPVGPDLAVIGRPGVYALGDLAMAKAEDGKPLPGLAQVADQQGRYLGRALRDRILHGKASKPFRFRSRGNLAIIGKNSGVVQWDHVKLKGFLAWVVWGVAHVYLLVGFHNRLVVTLRWLWAYLSFQRGARLISERDEAVMALIRGTPPGRIPPP